MSLQSKLLYAYGIEKADAEKNGDIALLLDLSIFASRELYNSKVKIQIVQSQLTNIINSWHFKTSKNKTAVIELAKDLLEKFENFEDIVDDILADESKELELRKSIKS